jgi:hypothetical protein
VIAMISRSSLFLFIKSFFEMMEPNRSSSENERQP